MAGTGTGTSAGQSASRKLRSAAGKRQFLPIINNNKNNYNKNKIDNDDDDNDDDDDDDEGGNDSSVNGQREHSAAAADPDPEVPLEVRAAIDAVPDAFASLDDTVAMFLKVCGDLYPKHMPDVVCRALPPTTTKDLDALLLCRLDPRERKECRAIAGSWGQSYCCLVAFIGVDASERVWREFHTLAKIQAWNTACPRLVEAQRIRQASGLAGVSATRRWQPKDIKAVIEQARVAASAHVGGDGDAVAPSPSPHPACAPEPMIPSPARPSASGGGDDHGDVLEVEQSQDDQLVAEDDNQDELTPGFRADGDDDAGYVANVDSGHDGNSSDPDDAGDESMHVSLGGESLVPIDADDERQASHAEGSHYRGTRDSPSSTKTKVPRAVANLQGTSVTEAPQRQPQSGEHRRTQKEDKATAQREMQQEGDRTRRTSVSYSRENSRFSSLPIMHPANPKASASDLPEDTELSSPEAGRRCAIQDLADNIDDSLLDASRSEYPPAVPQEKTQSREIQVPVPIAKPLATTMDRNKCKKVRTVEESTPLFDVQSIKQNEEAPPARQASSSSVVDVHRRLPKPLTPTIDSAHGRERKRPREPSTTIEDDDETDILDAVNCSAIATRAPKKQRKEIHDFRPYSLSCLRPQEWLTASVLDEAIRLLVSIRPNEFAGVQSHATQAEDVGRIDRMLRKSTCKMILVPLCVGNNHWVLMVIFLTHKFIEVYDSLAKDIDPVAAGGETPEVCKVAQKLMKRLFPDGNGQPAWPVEMPACPRQPNGFDCGVATVATAFYLVAGKALPRQHNWALWRRCLAWFLASSPEYVSVAKGLSEKHSSGYKSSDIRAPPSSVKFPSPTRPLSLDELENVITQSRQAQEHALVAFKPRVSALRDEVGKLSRLLTSLTDPSQTLLQELQDKRALADNRNRVYALASELPGEDAGVLAVMKSLNESREKEVEVLQAQFDGQKAALLAVERVRADLKALEDVLTTSESSLQH